MKEKDRFQLTAECCDIWNKTKNTPNKIINILINLKTESQQLKSELNDWKQRFNSSEERYRSLSQSSVECIRKKEERFKKEQSKVAIEKLEQVKEELLREWVPIEVAKVLGPYVIKINEMIKELKGEK